MAAKIPNDVYQFSLITAYKQGLTSSGPSCSALSGYGTHGIGCLANGANMVLLDSTPYQLKSDGSASPAPPDAALPFVMVTRFLPQFRAIVPASEKLSMTSLPHVLGGQGPEAGGQNSMMPFRIRGVFATVKTGSHVLRDVDGSLVGFAVPQWGHGISGSGMRCCLYGDEAGKKRGGLVSDFEAKGKVTLEWGICGRFHLGLPQGDAWESMTLA